MMSSENFSDYAKPDSNPLFHEAVSLPVVREWLGWDDATCEFKNPTTTDQFFSLISTSQDSTEDFKSPKITTYSQVRDLRLILANPEAKKVLLDSAKSFTEALAVTSRQQIIGSWKAEVAEAAEALKGIGLYDSENRRRGLEADQGSASRNRRDHSVGRNAESTVGVVYIDARTSRRYSAAAQLPED